MTQNPRKLRRQFRALGRFNVNEVRAHRDSEYAARKATELAALRRAVGV